MRRCQMTGACYFRAPSSNTSVLYQAGRSTPLLKENRHSTRSVHRSMKIQYLEFIGRRLRPIELKLFVKWALHLKRVRISLPDERVYEVDPISDLGLKLAKDSAYEPVMTEALEDLLEPGDCFMDLGANEGYFSVLAGKLVSPKGKVYAIEPQKRLWPVIEGNLLLNSLFNVHLVPFGIGRARAAMQLQLYPSVNSGASTFADSFGFKVSAGWLRHRLFGHQPSMIIPMDDLLDILPARVKLMKIDIEGFEMEALLGGANMMEMKVVEHFLIEIHSEALKSMGQSEDAIDGILSAKGYKKQRLSYNLNLYSLE